MPKSVDDLIEEANTRLAVIHSACRISRQGHSLYLRGTLPPKPDSGKTNSYQQTIALGVFGWKANPAAVKAAEKECLRIDAAISSKEFDWGRYSKKLQRPDSAVEWVDRYKEKWFGDRKNKDPRKIASTWNTDHWYVLKHLPDEPLTPELLLLVIEKRSEPNSRSRKRYCDRLKEFAKFAGISLDVKKLKGNYNRESLAPRDLPTEEMLIKYRKIFKGSWLWAYGILCCYGLRNHEIFFVDTEIIREPPGIAAIKDGKTGSHEVFPYYPEWWEEWQLWDVQMPECSGSTNGDLGHRVSQAFRRAKEAYKKSDEFRAMNANEQLITLNELERIVPYNLRHCWAVRTILIGLPDRLAAAQMGHSLEEHEKTYHKWLSRKHHQQMFDAILLRSDRPKPPTL